MQAVLAIDSGGTKTEALLVGLDGAVLGWGRSRPPAAAAGGAHLVGYGRSGEAIGEAVTQVLAARPAAGLHVGAAGITQLRQVSHVLACAATIELISEHVPAFQLAGETQGIVALAGTGAMAHACDRAGRSLRLDGLGPLLGDHGSGFGIGLRAMQAVARADWHTRRATSLADAIYAVSRRTGLFSGPDGLVSFMLQTRDRAQIAAFATLVDQEARKSDPVAMGILGEAARDMAETVRDVAARLEMQSEPYALIGTGSVMMRSDAYWQSFVEAVRCFAPAFRPVQLRHPAVAGTALHVLAKLPGGDDAAVRERLLRELDQREEEA